MKMYKRYNSYKESGLAWLGEIPSHWEGSTINALTRVVSRKNRPAEPLLSVYRDYGVILKSSRDDNYNKPGQDLSVYKYVKPTDLVLNKMKTWQGSLGVSELQGIVSPAYITCELDISKVFPKYLHYLLRCHNYIHEYNRLSYGVRTNQWDMRYDDFKKIPVFLPSNQEQRAIASFLDYKTPEIDRFITNKEKLITLLNEQKAAIINHAVTKGLNSNVPMKPSEVEGIGEIPKGWRLIKLKYVSQIDNSGVWGEEQGMLDIDTPVSTTAHLTRDGNWLIEQMPIRSFSKADYEYYSGKNGDIIIVKSSGSATNIITGKAGFIDDFSEGIIFSNFLMRVKPNSEQYEPKLLYYFLTSSIIIERIKRMVATTTYPNLKVEEYISNLIPIPSSKNEQMKIVNFLNRKTKQIDKLVSKERQKIELIKQYRQVLISQAVTGKIDVREIA